MSRPHTPTPLQDQRSADRRERQHASWRVGSKLATGRPHATTTRAQFRCKSMRSRAVLAFCWSEGLTNTPAHTSAGYASVERIGRGTPDLHSHPPAFRRARSARVLNVGGNVQVINILKNAECAKDTTCLKAIFSDEYGFMRCQTSISMLCKFLGVASNAANLSCGQQLVGRIGRRGAPVLKTRG